MTLARGFGLLKGGVAVLALTGVVTSCVQDLDGLPCKCVDGSCFCSPGFICCLPETECRRSESECKDPGAAVSSAGASGLGGAAGEERPNTSGGRGNSHAGNAGGPQTAGGASGAAPTAGADSGGTTGRANEGGLGGTVDEIVTAGAGCSSPLDESESVVTQHHDNQRTGANLHETVLNVRNVSANTFGKTAQRPLRGAVHTQPLYVANLKLEDGSCRNVVYVATMRNYVYAFDADDPSLEPYWVRQLASPIVLPRRMINPKDTQYAEIWGEVGVFGTPAIDLAESAMYIVAAHENERDDSSHRLHKLDLRNGEDLVEPVTLAANGVVDRVAVEELGIDRGPELAQQSALLFDRGFLYVSFGGYTPTSTLSGRISRFDTELRSAGQFNVDSNPGIWMNGQGPAVDPSGTLYATTQGSSLLALTPTPGSRVQSGFYAPELHPENTRERALGASGPLILPGAQRVAVAGGSYLYLFDTSKPSFGGEELGQEVRINSQGECVEPRTCKQMFGAPVFWANPKEPRLYTWAAGDALRAFRFDTATQRIDCGGAAWPYCNAVSQSTLEESGGNLGNLPRAPGGMLALSANGPEPGSAIVWTVNPHYDSPYDQKFFDGVVRAFDAENLRNLLWGSNTDARDELGPMSRFVTPVPVGGQVLVPTIAGFTQKLVFATESSSWGPSLTAVGDGTLVLSWAGGPAPAHLRLVWSHDGFVFTSPQTVLPMVSQFEPALASDRAGNLFVAYGDPASDPTREPTRVKAAVLGGENFSLAYPLVQAAIGEAEPEVLGHCDGAPALAYGDDKLYLAWRDAETGDIHVVSSSDGETFDLTPGTVIPETPPAAPGSLPPPALFFLNRKLYLVLVAEDKTITLLESADGSSFTNRIELGETSLVRPALAALTTSGASAPDYHLFFADPRWPEYGPMKLLIGEHDVLDLAAPGSRSHDLMPDETPHAIAATTFRGQIYVAWTGAFDNTNFPNIARYSPGELVSYGLK